MKTAGLEIETIRVSERVIAQYRNELDAIIAERPVWFVNFRDNLASFLTQDGDKLVELTVVHDGERWVHSGTTFTVREENYVPLLAIAAEIDDTSPQSAAEWLVATLDDEDLQIDSMLDESAVKHLREQLVETLRPAYRYAAACAAYSRWIKDLTLPLRSELEVAREHLKRAMIAAGHPVHDLTPSKAEAWYELNAATADQVF